ncbi:MAG: methyltransferase domain-containing protein [Candidatus Pacearchaeota archaeon]
MQKKFSSFDIIGSIAIVKFPDGTNQKEKKDTAKKILKDIKHVKTVVEKTERIKGRLRTMKTKFLAGVKTKETIHKENKCFFKINIDKCYFSSRQANERLEIAHEVKQNDKVLVMFSGVAPYSIVIAKIAKPKKVTSIELGRECCKFAKENVKLNKLDNVEIVQGDVKRIIPKLARKKIKFDKIVMPRPQLKDSFLHEAFLVSKKGTIIYYYDYSQDVLELIEKIEKQTKKDKKKIRVIKVKKAGEVAPYRYRWRIDFVVIN